MKYSKILLTGGTGQLGHELKQTLRFVGDFWAPNRNELDLTNLKSLRVKIEDFKPDLIVNAAAYTDVDGAERQPDLAWIINAKAPRVMAEEACRLNIPLIQYSTDYVFDGKKKAPYLEHDKTNPLNVYGETKLFAERIIQEIHKKNLIMRTSWIYNETRGQNFYRTMIKLFQEHEEVSVVTDQIGNPTSATFIAEKTAKIILDLNVRQEEETRWGLYHLTGHETMSWYNFAEKIRLEASKTSKDLKIKYIKPILSEDYVTTAERPKYSACSNRKVNTLFHLNTI